MTKLKTLKDITSAGEFDRVKFSVRNNITKLYEDKDLRQEAIKHIKEIGNPQAAESMDECIEKEAKIYWIKDFFNLTDEDLK